MGMYCCCERKIRRDDFECLCDWDGWISIHDWPMERKNKDIPLALPKHDGVYLCRIHSDSGDRYEQERHFSLTPIIITGGYTEKYDFEMHWGEDHWQDESPYAWKKVEDIDKEID